MTVLQAWEIYKTFWNTRYVFSILYLAIETWLLNVINWWDVG